MLKKHIRVTHAEDEGLATILGPELRIVEWTSVPYDLHEEKGQPHGVRVGAVGTEESARRMRDVALHNT